MLFCWSQGRPSVGTGVSYRRARRTGYSVFCARAGPNTRELCQSVCSSAIYRIPRPSRICASICRVSGRQRKSCSPLIGKPDVHAVSLLSTTPIAPSPKRRSGDSISNLSRAGRWPSAKRGRARNVARGAHRDPAGSAARGQAARRQVLAVRGREDSLVHRVPAVSRPGPTPPVARLRRAAASSALTRPPRTTGSRPARTATAALAAPSRSVRSAGSTTLTKTGALRTTMSTSTTSRPPQKMPTTSQLPQKTTIWTTTRDKERSDPACG